MGLEQMSIEDKLIFLKLIEGMFNISYKCKILEQLQTHNESGSMCGVLTIIGIY